MVVWSKLEGGERGKDDGGLVKKVVKESEWFEGGWGDWGERGSEGRVGNRGVCRMHQEAQHENVPSLAINIKENNINNNK